MRNGKCERYGSQTSETIAVAAGGSFKSPDFQCQAHRLNKTRQRVPAATLIAHNNVLIV